MVKKFLILIGRTFFATFVLVNFFNIIPINYSSNAWFVQVSMLFVDTGSFLLLGLSSLKLASFLSIKKEAELENIDLDEQLNQEKQNNLNVINKLSWYSMYIFIFIALLQFFVVVNGSSQLDILYSERILNLEKQYQINQNKLEQKINLEDVNTSKVSNSLNKDRLLENITNQKNSAFSYLVRNAIRVFLMSSIWAYGFFKLSKFS